MSDKPPHWRPFLGYMIVTMTLFIAVLAFVVRYNFDPGLAYAAGFAVSLPVDYIRAYFRDADEWRSSA